MRDEQSLGKGASFIIDLTTWKYTVLPKQLFTNVAMLVDFYLTCIEQVLDETHDGKLTLIWRQFLEQTYALSAKLFYECRLEYLAWILLQFSRETEMEDIYDYWKQKLSGIRILKKHAQLKNFIMDEPVSLLNHHKLLCVGNVGNTRS